MSREIVENLFKIIGTDQEKKMFLNIFHSSDSHKFAVIIIEHKVLEDNLDLLGMDLAFLSQLELTPIILVEEKKIDLDLETKNFSKELIKRIRKYGGKAKSIPLKNIFGKADNNKISWYENSFKGLLKVVDQKEIPVLVNRFQSGDQGKIINIDRVASEILENLAPRKFIRINATGGIKKRNGDLISFLEIHRDLPELIENELIDKKTVQIVKSIEKILCRVHKKNENLKMHSQMTSAGGLLKELFTIQGSGTYFNLSNEILKLKAKEIVDQKPYDQLLENGFDLRLKPHFKIEEEDLILRDKNFRALAILKPVSGMWYLDKFVVDSRYQSEGWGNSLWREIKEQCPKLFWRTKKTNTLGSWYFKHSDGHHSDREWCYFWSNVNEKGKKIALNYAKSRKDSFVRA